MVTEDEIRAKGWGVVLDEPLHSEKISDSTYQRDESVPLISDQEYLWYARWLSLKDWLGFSLAVNVALALFCVWLMWMK